jgi:hypothetical protein
MRILTFRGLWEDGMRLLLTLGVILLVSGLATGQVMTDSNSVVAWIPAPGVYAVPFAPLVSTPSVSLSSPQSSPMSGNAASAILPPADTLYAQPVWYDPEVQLQVPVEVTPRASQVAEGEWFRFGAASFQSSYGAAQLAAGAHISSKNVRTYTNQDVENTNRNNGSVSYKGKTKHMD